MIVITGIIGALGSMMLYNGFNAYFFGKNLTEIDWQGRLAMERLSRDLRRVRSATAADLTISPGSQIAFTDVNGTNISYALNGTILERNGQPLADGVSTLGFSYLMNDGKSTAAVVDNVYYITVEMTINNGTANRSFRSTVHPRSIP